MKLKVLFIAAVLSLFTSSAFAQFFAGRVNVQVLPLQVSAQVFNPYYEPIICSGQVYGQPAYSPMLTTFFAEQFIPAGGYRFAFVQTMPHNPFVRGWANINCRFARWGY